MVITSSSAEHQHSRFRRDPLARPYRAIVLIQNPMDVVANARIRCKERKLPASTQEVWNYKFVAQTNLVDVHMGRLRRKVDELDEPPMIHNVRGLGFLLRAPT